MRIGDRALLRCSGRPIASVVVLDVRPPSLRRRGAAARRAQELAPFGLTDSASASVGPASGGAGKQVGRVPDAATVLRWRGIVRRSELAAMGCDPEQLDDVPGAGDWVVDPDRWTELVERLKALVGEQPGIPADAARTALALPARELVDALVKTCAPLSLADGRIDGTGVPADVAAAVDRLRAELAGAPYQVPEGARLAALGLNARTVAWAARAGLVLRLSDGVVLLPGADVAAARVLGGLPQPFTAGEARIALGTSRRVAIPLLEHLDRLGLTRRIDDRLRVVITDKDLDVDGSHHHDPAD
ncbi:hypothetical protein HII36_48645 [Nonomuraea sp. NN258]|nr:hypothetical protein [Nonomuraea antri]